MRHHTAVWTLARQSLETGVPVALLYVVESLGSSPGRAGFALTVTADQTAGSMGGGAMEHRFLAEARRRLVDDPRPFLQRQVHDAAAVEDRSGMICSGEQTFFFWPLSAADLPVVVAVEQAALARSGGVLSLTPQGLAYEAQATRPVRHRFVAGSPWWYEEDWGQRDRLHIVGGGHCALALSHLASTLDFEITVYDDRPGLPTFEANSWAHHKVLVPSYAQIAQWIEPGPDQYVCVMTFGYKTDDVALRSLLPQTYGFLGALGSRTKIDQLLAAFSADGFSDDQLRRLQAPMGVPIHSQTPEEIAVSIAAQLIRVKNQPSRESS